MHFKNLVLAASVAVTASALPATGCRNPNTTTNDNNNTFGIVAIHSGSNVQYASFNAALSSIFAGLSTQNASCDRPDEQSATFYIKDGALYLYAASATPQEVYVDRSGMGHGKIGSPPALNPLPITPSAPGGLSKTAISSLVVTTWYLIAC